MPHCLRQDVLSPSILLSTCEQHFPNNRTTPNGGFSSAADRLDMFGVKMRDCIFPSRRFIHSFTRSVNDDSVACLILAIAKRIYIYTIHCQFDDDDDDEHCHAADSIGQSADLIEINVQ